jgi:hypothetical protein
MAAQALLGAALEACERAGASEITLRAGARADSAVEHACGLLGFGRDEGSAYFLRVRQ